MLDNFDQLIAVHGLALQGVFPTKDDPGVPWMYTVGLTLNESDAFCYEIAATGMTNEMPNYIHSLLEDMDAFFPLNERVPNIAGNGFDLWFREISLFDEDYPLSMARRYPQERGLPIPTKAVQMVWPDKENRFPWEPGYDYENFLQPLIREP